MASGYQSLQEEGFEVEVGHATGSAVQRLNMPGQCLGL